MKKIAVYLVRYKETESLADCLRSVGNHPNVDVFVINNFDRLVLSTEFNYVQVLDNLLRPDYSTGHLSRNWNQAIINGFRDLDNPSNDIVIGIQADALLANNWYEEINKLDDSIQYMALGRGDEFQYFTAAGIKTVGLYDERFCNIGYQEADYFLRNVLFNKNASIIIDDVHGRHCNSSEINSDLFLQKSETNFNDSHRLSMGFHHISRKWFHIKWNELDPQYWNFSNIINIQNFFFKENMLYPYFEFKINPNLYEINKPS